MTAFARIKSAGLALLALVTVIAGSASAQDRFDRRIMVINESNRVIHAFHSTNKSVAVWGRDLLGAHVILPGQSWVVNLDDLSGYCRFDLKAVMDTGQIVERYNVDVCTAVSWTIY